MLLPASWPRLDGSAQSTVMLKLVMARDAGYILQLSWTSPAAAVWIPCLHALQCWRRQTAGTRQFRAILPAGASCLRAATAIAAIKHSHPVLLMPHCHAISSSAAREASLQHLTIYWTRNQRSKSAFEDFLCKGKKTKSHLTTLMGRVSTYIFV